MKGALQVKLNQFKNAYHTKETEDKNLNIVICIYHKMGLYRKSTINELLEKLQENLKQECKNYEKVQIAYVYETPSLNVKKFAPFTKESPIYYKEPCIEKSPHSLANVWFMGLALLEQIQEDCEKRMYFVTDERFDVIQVNQIVYQKEDKFMLNSRFTKSNIQLFLVKSGQTAGGELLEDYIRIYGEVL